MSYKYPARPDETEPPWGDNDLVVLEVNAPEIWLGEEIHAGMTASGYEASMTSGFVHEMVHQVSNIEQNIQASLHRADDGQVQLYGLLSIVGFRENLKHAAE